LLVFGLLAVFLFLSHSGFSQNTKGDRPVNNQRKVRETKGKSFKRKEKGNTRDLTGRRLRTKNKSSANRANASYPQFAPGAQKNRATKGDRPAQPRNRTFTQSPRESRTRAWKGDVSGHSIRKIKPSKSGIARNNVYPQFGRYVSNPSRNPKKISGSKRSTRTATGQPIVKRVPQQKQRAWKGNIRNGKVGTRSATGTVDNVYPQKNAYSRVTKSPKPRRTPTYNNSGIVNRNERLGSGPEHGGKKISGNARTATRPFIKRGKRNVYWGKSSKGEKANTRDLTGGPLRTRNFRSMPAGLVGRDTLKHFGRKPGGDRSYQRRRKRGALSAAPRVNKPWSGDVAGFRVRSPRKRNNGQLPGKFVFPRKLSVSGKANRSSPLPGSGYRSISHEGKDNQRLPGRNPGIGALILGKALAKTKGRRTTKGGGSVSGAGWNNKGQPVDVNGAGQGTIRASKFQGTFKRFGGFGNQGGDYSGNIKSRRPIKGGGSVSGKLWNNRQSPIGVRVPGAGSARAGKYTGNFRAGDLKPGMRDQGEEFTGTMKSRRPIKGGGSVSGKLWNNRQSPIGVRTPGAGSERAGKFSGNFRAGDLKPGLRDQGEEFSGNIKSRRPLKGGGSVSGKLWNNRQSPIGVRTPGTGSERAGKFTGNVRVGDLKPGFRNQGEEFTGTIKSRRPLKGGGSVSGKLWNNRQTPIGVRTPGAGSERAGKFTGNVRVGDLKPGLRDQGEEYTGNIKARGSKKPRGKAADVGKYSGNVEAGGLRPGFRNQGEEFTGFIKTRRPLKGGGSVSGKLWNNNETPIDVRTPLSKDAKAANYAGKDKLRRGYIQNPNAFDESIKKLKPNKNVFEVSGLQVRVKRNNYEKKPNASEVAMKGIAPNKSTVKASEYTRSMKMFWNYKRNPSSSEYALKVKDPSGTWAKSTTFAGRTRLIKSYKHNPRSADEALKILAPGKAYARIGDFQGNIKMRKFNDNRFHPDAQFAHNHRNNVDSERTILMDVKLLWAKLFKKSDNQPTNVKEKVRRPRYDRGEKGLWAEDEDFKKK
jgi:hypothetical protein